VDQADAGHEFEQFASDMLGSANAGRRHIDLARIGLGVGNEFRNGSRRKRRMHLHDERHEVDPSNRRDIAEKIEVELFIERAVDSILRIDQQESVAIGRRASGRLGRNIAAGTGANLDDELLAEALRHPLRYQTRRNVRRATGGLPDDNAHGPSRICLRAGATRQRRKRACARHQLQKSTTRNFH
jgi:hypothetical protein